MNLLYVVVDCPTCGLPVAYKVRGRLVGNRVLIGVVGAPSSVCGHVEDQHPSATMTDT